jgi:hypothetical protein
MKLKNIFQESHSVTPDQMRTNRRRNAAFGSKMTGYTSVAIPDALRRASIRLFNKLIRFDEPSCLVGKIIKDPTGRI